MNRRRLAGLFAFTTLMAVTLAGVATLISNGPNRERRFAGAELAALRQEGDNRPDLANDPVYRYWLGRRLNENGKFVEAATVLETAAGLEPGSARVRDEWARALVGTGKPSAAYAQLMQFAGTGGGADGQRLLGKFHASQGAYPAAATALEKAVSLNPRDAEAWSWLAQARLKLGRGPEAEEAVRNALRYRPDGADAAPDYLQLAILQTGSDPTGALNSFRKAVALAPGNAEAHREYARFLLTRAEYDAAADEARRAIDNAPDDATAFLLLGRALMEQGAGYEAIAPLEKAAKLAPEDPLPALELSRLYRRGGSKEKERETFWRREADQRGRIAAERKGLLETLRVRPADRSARTRLAQLYARSGDVASCVRESALALSAAPDSARALTAAARMLSDNGHPNEALDLLRRVAREQEQMNNPTLYEAWGDALLRLERFHEAAIAYQRISDVVPEKVNEFKTRISAAIANRKARNLPTDAKLDAARAALSAGDEARARENAEAAVRLDADNTNALRLLLGLYFFRRGTDPMARTAARATAERLMNLSVEDGVSRACLAVLLLEQPGAVPDLERTEALLREAEYDPSATATYWYARGLLAKQRGDNEGAKSNFAEAARRDRRFAAEQEGTGR